MTITNINELAKYLGTTVPRIGYDFHRMTECGAWISYDTLSITIGASVEGAEVRFIQTLFFPFSSASFEDLVEEMENYIDEAWGIIKEAEV